MGLMQGGVKSPLPSSKDDFEKLRFGGFLLFDARAVHSVYNASIVQPGLALAILK